ncbi:MAG: hypothetical protein FJ088_07990 [Deltaproteobacteria bacterium]|nr:hypothetical protein [Deltaproteobacteria bacterium]
MNLGLTMKSPIFKMYSNIEVTAFSGNAMEVTSFTDGSTTISEFDADTVFPWGGVLSFAFFVRDGETGKPKFAADLDVDYTHSFQDEATEIDYRWVVNVRGGAELYVSDRVSLYGGFFTDFNPNKESMFSEFTDRKVDYYGGSFGVRWFNVYKTTETEKSDKIVFSTTLGLRYTYGTGKIYGMMLDYTKEEGFEGVVELVEKDTIMHNIAVYVGSSLEF